MKRILSKLILILAIISATMLLAVCNDAHVCNYDQLVVTDEYLFSPATCEDFAIYYYSCTCGAMGDDMFGEGDCLGHDYGLFISNHDGTHTKVCLNDDTHKVTESCSGGTATIKDKPVCSLCNTAYGSCLPHDHKYNQQVSTSEYLCSPATCSGKAKYYYSCECGQSGTQTFEYGNLLDHKFVYCTSNGDDTHTKVCANDEGHKITEECSGGTPTKTEKAICSQCKSPYGEILGHVHNYTQKVADDKYLCNKATCESAATYYYSCECGEQGSETFIYGSSLGHNYLNVCTPNSNGTHTKTCVNDTTHTVTENCSGGTATQTQRAVCEYCNVEYGGVLGHVHEFNVQVETTSYMKSDQNCESGAIYYYSCICGTKGNETFEVGTGFGHNYDNEELGGDGVSNNECVNCGKSKLDND